VNAQFLIKPDTHSLDEAKPLYCAKISPIDIERHSQLPFMMFKGEKDHDDNAIKDVQAFIEANIDERVTVEFLASKFAMRKRNFIRRFKKATNNVPLEYIQKVKMEVAKRSLELNRKNVNEVMYSVGYTDVKAFRTILKRSPDLAHQNINKNSGRIKVILFLIP
jgi:transcriptional regulator GlxA family with amidase domain